MTPYEYAVEYINHGLAVFPLHYKGKTPLTKNGCKDATTDAAIVKSWWQKYPNANVAIATGSKSKGLFVIDLDIDEDKGINGYQSLKDWEREYGELPETCSTITGRGGNHLLFRSDKAISNRASLLDGVDVRGEGGYIVAPPSVHPNGKVYEWEYGLDEFPIQQASGLVYQLLRTRRTNERNSEFILPEKITAGKRNDTIFKFACSLQAKGLINEAIIAAIRVENEKRCEPPLDEEELMQTINSALRYEKGQLEVKKDSKAVIKTVTEVLKYNDKGSIIQSIDNICNALRYDEFLAGKLKWNTLSYSPFIVGKVPWEKESVYREWNNSDDSNLKCYIESRYGLRSLEKIMEALNIIVNENKFNPVCEFLESLQWDGVNRIENILPDYLGVEKGRYSAECMKLFMLGAINRAYYPGCKFDYMPVLVGEQGVGKSTFFRLLAGNDAWYNDNFNSVDGDKATEKLRGMWIVELAELLAVKKSQAVESIKAFLTSTVDTYRPPYGRRTEQRPRVCVFAGTTNSTHFLTDRTGNRRYLPLLVNRKNVKKSLFDNQQEIINEFSQAWAEAMYIFKNDKPKLVLPRELEDYAKKMQEDYVEEDVRVGIIKEWLDNTVNKKVCIAMIYEQALGNEFTKPNRKESSDLHDIMSAMDGWRRMDGLVRCGKYGPQRCYERYIENPFEQEE